MAGYAEFHPDGGSPTLLIHPSDQTTGVSYSLISLTQAIIGELLTTPQARRSADLIAKHLLFADGAHLMDKPLTYRGGPQTIFRRGESAAFFGREIGLMYVHAHLRYGEAMRALGDAKALWEALLVANPIAVTELLRHASLRQRNAYFTSSDAAFRDRYEASANWQLAKTGAIAVDGGWRIYSSGPGVYVSMVVETPARRHAALRQAADQACAAGHRIRICASPACRRRAEDTPPIARGRPPAGC